MKQLIVLNGQFYCGENKEDNKLMFDPDRSKAIEVDERRVRYIVHNIYGWYRYREIKLQRLEIIDVKEKTCVNVANAKDKLVNARLV
ncbi:MAG: hypothetical protein APF81_03830 [Desulfosporosinus sp. BRH_c37]|nr:MAG: hypothetical protein APF81_03830 [Desulfosporosinus sp. BRH_c37]